MDSWSSKTTWFPWQLKSRRRERRPEAGLFQQASNDDDDDIGDSDDLLGSPPLSPSMGREVAAAKPGRKSGWWTDEAPKSGRKTKDTFQEPEDERLKITQRDFDSDNDMPLIPDLDDVQEEELANEVAQAPQMAVNRAATYKELDTDLLKHSAFATLDDIDLRALMKYLVPESELKEKDSPWSWDFLFTEVTSELNTEWESEADERPSSST